MAGTPDGADLERLLAERGTQLMRVAIALTGDRQSGEDLLQAALERVLRKPHAVESDTEGYLRRILYNLAADGWRRQGRWRQRLPLLRPRTGRGHGGPHRRRQPAGRLGAPDAPVPAAPACGDRACATGSSAPKRRPRSYSAAPRARSSPPRHGGCGGCANWCGTAARRGRRAAWRERHDQRPGRMLHGGQSDTTRGPLTPGSPDTDARSGGAARQRSTGSGGGRSGPPWPLARPGGGAAGSSSPRGGPRRHRAARRRRRTPSRT